MAENLGSGSSVDYDRPLKKLKLVVHGEDLQGELVVHGEDLQEELVQQLLEKKLKSNQLQPEEDEELKSDVIQSSVSSSRSSDKSVIEDDREQNEYVRPSIESIEREALERGWKITSIGLNPMSMRRVWPEHSFPRWMDLEEEEKYRPEGVKEVDWDLWRKYYRELRESDYFDLEHYPGHCRKARVRPIPDFKECPETYHLLRSMSEFAIDDYNQKNNTNYSVEDVEKANVGAVMDCTCYFITLRAKNKDEPDHRVFQAEVVHNYYRDGDDVTRVELCRPKPLAHSTSSD